MFRLTTLQANVYAVIISVITLVGSYFLPEHSITYTGYFLVIILSMFVEGRRSTLIAIWLTVILIIGFLLFHPHIPLTAVNITKHLFAVLVAFFISMLVLHVKELYARMEQDKSHLASLFENATEGIVLTTREGKIILANPAACRMFAYDEQDLVGQAVEVLLPKRYRAGHVQLRHGFVQHPQNREMGSGRDLHGQRKDGTTFPVEVSLSTYKQNNDLYIIAFIVDITHRKEIEQSMLQQQQQLEKVSNDIRKLNAELEAKVEERTIILKEALQRLEQSQAELSEALDKEKQLSEIKSRFVSMASHEFRTPLSAILSSASLLSKYTTTDQQPNRNKHITRIKESVKHLNDLLEDFLSLGKLDEGKVGASFDECNLPDVIHDTIDEVRGLVKEGQEIHYEHHGPETVETDKKLLKNIMINLISNALKFSEKYQVVEVKSEISNSHAEISVADKGIGISEEDQHHLFTSFFRGKNALNIQGTGLGLHIVKRYTDLIGGNINLTSRLGEGTTIKISIPIKQNNHEQNSISH